MQPMIVIGCYNTWTLLTSFMDRPATGPRLVEETESYEMGKPGFVTDLDQSLPAC